MANILEYDQREGKGQTRSIYVDLHFQCGIWESRDNGLESKIHHVKTTRILEIGLEIARMIICIHIKS